MLGLKIHPPGTPATEAFAEEHPLEAVPLSPVALVVPVLWNSATADRRTGLTGIGHTGHLTRAFGWAQRQVCGRPR
jgi:hypothetical protein